MSGRIARSLAPPDRAMIDGLAAKHGPVTVYWDGERRRVLFAGEQPQPGWVVVYSTRVAA